jgi:hypothetical protein
MLQRKPSDPRQFMVKIVAHYDDLARQFNANSLTQKWFNAHYKPSAILHDRAKTILYQGPKQILKFWQNLRASGVTSISFNFGKDALPKIFQVDMKVKHIPPKKKKHDYIEMAVISCHLEFPGQNVSADPEFDILVGHWDVCPNYPESEIIG